MFDPQTDFVILREVRDERARLEKELEDELAPLEEQINQIKLKRCDAINEAKAEETELREYFDVWYRQMSALRLEQQLAGDLPPPIPLPAGVSATALRYVAGIDPEKLPEECWTPDEKKIKALVKKGSSVDGVTVDVKYSIRLAGEK